MLAAVLSSIEGKGSVVVDGGEDCEPQMRGASSYSLRDGEDAGELRRLKSELWRGKKVISFT